MVSVSYSNLFLAHNSEVVNLKQGVIMHWHHWHDLELNATIIRIQYRSVGAFC